MSFKIKNNGRNALIINASTEGIKKENQELKFFVLTVGKGLTKISVIIV